MRQFHQQLMLSGSVSGSVNTTSLGFPLKNMEGYSVQAVFSQSGSLPPLGVTGSFKLQASNGRTFLQQNDPCANIKSWVDLPGTLQILSASAGSHASFLWNMSSAYYGAVRVFVSGTSGTGSLDINVVGKGPVA